MDEPITDPSMNLIRHALQRGVEKKFLVSWTKGENEKWWVEVADPVYTCALQFNDGEVVAFCHGMLAAS